MTDVSGVRAEESAPLDPARRYYRRIDAAAYVTARHFPCSHKTLAKLAVIGGGPLFRKAGRFPIYSGPDLDEWAGSKISEPVHSTSELRAR
jgi:hypothetical protein